MILYNVTVKIENGKKSEWLRWMKEIHIPDVMKTGLFKEYRLSRLLEQDEQYGTTYSIQYLCIGSEEFETYQSEHALGLQKEHTEKFKNHFVAFRTLMEVLDQS